MGFSATLRGAAIVSLTFALSCHILLLVLQKGQPQVSTTRKNEYRSYLLRLWRPQGESWRAQVECVISGKRHSFRDLENLVEFIRDQKYSDMSEPERTD
jgi:hypothetical protein